MNYLTSQLANCHIADVRRAAATQVTWHKEHHQRTPLRRRVGFALIEAGLRLVSGAAEPAGTPTIS